MQPGLRFVVPSQKRLAVDRLLRLVNWPRADFAGFCVSGLMGHLSFVNRHRARICSDGGFVLFGVTGGRKLRD